ncbi:MAG: exodeoxyribonuclease V subunit gamma, partial [Actinobacteria bacterium]|nr:exodeoxyribonuclease V subunit gamma [Actinomycetota bacterium]
KQILVVGFQSLSPGQIDALLQLKEHVEIRVVLVHPSPAISKKWAVAASSTAGASATIGLIPERNPSPVMPTDIDPLVNSWLMGSQELETLLASQDIKSTHAQFVGANSQTAQTLLGRIQTTVSQQLQPNKTELDTTDHSLIIHRCHNLGRQIEVLHDALLHAFNDLKDLQPHEIVVLCPNIATAAPYLEATFARTVQVGDSGGESEIASAGGTQRGVKIPLVVADRGIRQISEGSALLASLIDLVQSRCSIEGVLSVATSPLVLENLGVSSEGVEHWYRYVENANVRWGLTVEHRKLNGLNAPELSAHTWRAGLEQMLLGALVADGTQTFDSLAVDALDDVDLSDIDEISALIRVFDAVLQLADLANHKHTVEQWCDAIETSIVSLCGETCDDLAMPLKQLSSLRASAAGNTVEVDYSDVASQLNQMLNEVPGRQPLRTGAITATSMIPLRGVPFRVVCVVGFDEDSLSSSEGEGDDLIERQRMIGDSDSRLDVRRSLLDATLAAQERLIITCTGQSIKNNQRLPLATPLAEFVDFARRLGVGQHSSNKNLSAIEIEHPRHTTSVRNFFNDAVQSGVIWSHDNVARQAAITLGDAVDTKALQIVELPTPVVLTPELLEKTYVEPLDIYLRQTLEMFVHRKNEQETPAIIPLDIDKKMQARLAQELLMLTSVANSPGAQDTWQAEVRRSGVVPPAPFGDEAFQEVQDLVEAMQSALAGHGIDVAALVPVAVDLEISPGVKLVGDIPMCTQGVEKTTSVICYRAGAKSYEYEPALRRLAVRLLIARAAGVQINKGYVLARHEKWPNDPKHIVRERTVVLAESITQAKAKERLAILCEMARIALVSPCATFGDTATAASDEMVYEFDSFVSSDNFHTTNEFIVFGDDPMFSEIFHAKSPVLKFWKLHQSVLGLPKDDRPKVYIVS